MADTISKAERDGSISHGLFRLPGYVASLRSKKVKGNAIPKVEKISKSAVRVLGDYGFAPMALKVGIPALVNITKDTGGIILKYIGCQIYFQISPK